MEPDQQFARRHGRTLDDLAEYRRGEEDRRAGKSMHPVAMTNRARGWYAAGWHDEDMAQGVRITEV